MKAIAPKVRSQAIKRRRERAPGAAQLRGRQRRAGHARGGPGATTRRCLIASGSPRTLPEAYGGEPIDTATSHARQPPSSVRLSMTRARRRRRRAGRIRRRAAGKCRTRSRPSRARRRRRWSPAPAGTPRSRVGQAQALASRRPRSALNGHRRSTRRTPADARRVGVGRLQLAVDAGDVHRRRRFVEELL
jgi:hypothetical protein